MKTHKLILPEHLNNYGFLFGGYLMQWIDEHAYIVATIQYPGNKFVTIALDNVVFKKSITDGSILIFDINEVSKGNTSITYNAKVLGRHIESNKETFVFETNITFVNVDENGNKSPIKTLNSDFEDGLF
ncbi:MAG: acyl-CoA thioesterase [Kiritimatiellae bacterium]|jgi:acyl-CoA hydrolase|nr:acyl-CoA thioesterase [Kiritimatiellia bacterium]